MIVVADTSVLLNLGLVGQIRLLHVLFGAVLIPEAVQAEFERLAATSGRFAGLLLPEWVQTKQASPVRAADERLQHLDPGEREAIALAVELNADAVLMDENEGRAVARAHGLRTIGIAGILIQARHSGHLPAIRPVLDALRDKARFRLSDALVRQALEMCQE